jgi:hypothetical protein
MGKTPLEFYKKNITHSTGFLSILMYFSIKTLLFTTALFSAAHAHIDLQQKDHLENLMGDKEAVVKYYSVLSGELDTKVKEVHVGTPTEASARPQALALPQNTDIETVMRKRQRKG